MEILVTLLLIVGLFCVFIELLMPGFGIFGILGIIFIILSWGITISTFKLGIVIVLIEIIFISILLFLITFIGNFINMIIIPFVLISTALAIVSKVSERIQLDKLSKFFNSAVIWVLGIVLTIFVGLASVEGSLSSTVDGVTAKTTKAAVSNFIPVVGKILGDAVETVIGCGAILKNAVGIIGVIVVISICMAPIIKLAILMGLYYLCAAVCQPIADGKIIKLLDQMGDTFKILFAILCSISIMLIIGVTLVIKISNSGLMYR